MSNDLLSHVHWLAVLAGAAAYWILGALWYSRMLFANPWIKAHNIKVDDPDAKKGLGMMLVVSFILMFIASTGLGLLSSVLYIPDVMHAVKLGFLVGVCFCFTACAIGYVYTRKPLALYVIDGGYHLVASILAAVVIKLLS